MKILYGVVSVLVVFVTVVFLYLINSKAPDLSKEIFNFDDCVKQGNIVMESYPRQCRTTDGRTFAEEIKEKITYINSNVDDITVELPFPGAVTGKEFSVIGKARGKWYFEASFPIEVLDKDGNRLFIGPAQAEGEWMTEEFVPFKLQVRVPESYIGPATIILKKDNPSGEVQFDASISFPINIEY
jgi:hypothetical protein